jgi:hypothetical protein
MMRHSIWPESNGGHKPLPAPNVVAARAGTPPDQLSPEAVKGILVNPIYTGVGPFPRLVEDAAWGGLRLVQRRVGPYRAELGPIWAVSGRNSEIQPGGSTAALTARRSDS